MTTSLARWISLACALVAACAYALSVWVGAWWSIGDVTVGPLGSFACFAGECRARGLAWLGAGARWERTAFATSAAGLFAMALLVVLAASVAARRRATVVARTALVAVVTGLACAAYIVATFPDLPGAHLAIGAVAFAVASVLGGVAVVVAPR